MMPYEYNTTEVVGVIPPESFEEGYTGGWCSTYEIGAQHFKMMTGRSLDKIFEKGPLDVSSIRFTVTDCGPVSPMVAALGTMDKDEFIMFESDTYPAALLRSDGSIVRGHCTSLNMGNEKTLSLKAKSLICMHSSFCFQISAETPPEAPIYFTFHLHIPK
jgi:hypothetical protein